MKSHDLTAHSRAAQVPQHPLVRHDYAPGEIVALIKEQTLIAEQRIAQMLKAQPKTFANTIEAFETILADLIERTKPARFMRFVHTSKEVRDDAKEAQTRTSAFIIKTTSRQDIYDALSAVADAGANPQHDELTEAQQRLRDKILREFRKRGFGTPPQARERITAMQQELSELQTRFEANIAESTARITATVEELEGVPQMVLSRLEHDDDGNFILTTNGTDFVPVLQYAKDPGVRKRMLHAYENRAAEENTTLFERALHLRRELAASLGYSTWADFRAEDKMAKTATAVAIFLSDLRGKLAARNAADLDRLLSRKRRDNADALLFPWDLAYYETLIRKEELDVDDEEIRQYFPAERTITRMFEIYSTLFGITITQVPPSEADAWADRVQLYEVRDEDGTLISHFFTDFYPREGKFEHAAAFTLCSGRMLDGTYVTPVSAIVSNFTPPTADAPSLLSHDEVATLFHEFGHIMHQDLTRAPYAFISGTDVPMDFVEMPSQIMENWVWDESVLARISAHHKTGKPLPAALIKRMVDARHFNEARHYTRQLANSIYDLQIHMSTEPVDPTVLWKIVYKEVTTLEPLEDTHYPAGFGHLMGGYDAGYYSYLWSEVYEKDLFTRFKRDGLLNPKVGKEYRRLILEPGDSRDPMVLMREFLGREPSSDAFFESIGIR